MLQLLRAWVSRVSRELPEAWVSGVAVSQLALGLAHDGAWHEFRRLLRAVVDFVGVKQVAYDLDVAPSILLNALEERDRHHVRADWLPYLVRKAPNDDLVTFLASLRGLDVVPRRELTDAEKLERLDGVLKRHLGEGIWRGFYEEAFGRGKANGSDR